MKLLDVVSMLMVGAFWGCTNPWIRRGALEATTGKSPPSEPKHGSDSGTAPVLPQQWFKAWLRTDAMRRFLDYRVWLPYVLNQAGSGVYYFLLSSSDLTMAVPICNGLALVFSCITSSLLGERVDKPGRAILGSAQD
jgi:Putative transmembrane family 234